MIIPVEDTEQPDLDDLAKAKASYNWFLTIENSDDQHHYENFRRIDFPLFTFFGFISALTIFGSIRLFYNNVAIRDEEILRVCNGLFIFCGTILPGWLIFGYHALSERCTKDHRHFTKQIVLPLLKRFIGVLESMFVICGSAAAGMQLLDAVRTASVRNEIQCAENSIEDLWIVTFISPVILQAFAKCRFFTVFVAWLIAWAFIMIAYLESISCSSFYTPIYCSFLGMFIYEIERRELKLFVTTKELSASHQLSADRDLLQQTLKKKSDEMKRIISSVSHDLLSPIQALEVGVETLDGMVLETGADLMSPVCDISSVSRSQKDVSKDLNLQLSFESYTFKRDSNVCRDMLLSMKGTLALMSSMIRRCQICFEASDGSQLMAHLDTFDFVESVMKIGRYMSHMQNRFNITLQFQLHRTSNTIHTDKQWFEDNVLCLLSNAVKYSEVEDVDVIVKVIEEKFELDGWLESDAGGDSGDGPLTPSATLTVEVIDSGKGISDDVRKSFFARPDVEGRLQMGGAGLGLFAMAKRIEALGGKVGSRSRSDDMCSGSIFWFTIPVSLALATKSVEAQRSLEDAWVRAQLQDSDLAAPTAVTAAVALQPMSCDESILKINGKVSELRLSLPVSKQRLQRTLHHKERQARKKWLRPSSSNESLLNRCADAKPSGDGSDSEDAAEMETDNETDRVTFRKLRGSRFRNVSIGGMLGSESTAVYTPVANEANYGGPRASRGEGDIENQGFSNGHDGSYGYESPFSSQLNSMSHGSSSPGRWLQRAHRGRSGNRCDHLSDISSAPGKEEEVEEDSPRCSPQRPSKISSTSTTPPRDRESLVRISHNDHFHPPDPLSLSKPPEEFPLSLVHPDGLAKANVIAVSAIDIVSACGADRETAAKGKAAAAGEAREVKEGAAGEARVKEGETSAGLSLSTCGGMGAIGDEKSNTREPAIDTPLLEGLSVLTVDDSLSIMKMMTMRLQRAGHEVDQAHNGAVALEKMKKKHYDVVLMDMQMPVMDGCTAVTQFREFESFCLRVSQCATQVQSDSNGSTFLGSSVVDIDFVAEKQFAFPSTELGVPPSTMNCCGAGGSGAAGKCDGSFLETRRGRQLIIGMSANMDPSTRQQALDSGMDAFLPKPFAIEAAMDIVATALAGKTLP